MSGVSITEQAPLAVHLGQAVAAEKGADGKWSDGTLLDARCVGGNVKSTLDVMKRTGSTALGFTVSSHEGLGLDGGPGLVVTSAAHDNFFLSPQVGDPYFGATLSLRDVGAFEEALTPSDTRLAGFAETVVQHNAFWLDDERQLPGDGDCASRYVRGFTAKRFFLYGFRIDFANEADRTEFGTKYYQGINALFTSDGAVQQFLVERGASVSAYVLVSTGLRGYAEKGVAGQSCSASNLAGCQALHAKLADLRGGMLSMPGNDDTVPATQAEGSTWGAYGVWIQTYDHVLPMK